MAVIKQRVDDVLRAQGKTVEATQKARVVIPGAVSDSGKPTRLDLDVSAQGKTALDKMIRDAEEATRRAWAPILALKPRRSAPAKKAQDAAAPEDEGRNEDVAEDPSQPEQPSAFPQPGYGQS